MSSIMMLVVSFVTYCIWGRIMRHFSGLIHTHTYTASHSTMSLITWMADLSIWCTSISQRMMDFSKPVFVQCKQNRWYSFIILYDGKRNANEVLLHYWKERFSIGLVTIWSNMSYFKLIFQTDFHNDWNLFLMSIIVFFFVLIHRFSIGMEFF